MPTLTFLPDADPETSTVDGELRRNGVEETWAEIRDTADAVAANDSSTGFTVGLIAHATTDRWSAMYRSVLLFDTSAIPDGATITGASLFLLRNGATSNDFAQSVYVTSANPASNTGLVEADYSQLGTTKYNSGISIDDFSSVLVHTEVPLNAAGIAAINKSGITKFGLRLSGDIDDDEPVWSGSDSSLLGIKSADTADTASDPYLSVTYVSGDTTIVTDVPIYAGQPTLRRVRAMGY